MKILGCTTTRISSFRGENGFFAPPPLLGLHIFFFLLLIGSGGRTATLLAAAATTDPSEVEALNTMLGRWGYQQTSTWNISGEPCSGIAVDNTNIDNNNQYNPAITCDCSYINNTVCHIIKLKVYALNVVGEIPEELQNLTYLQNLNLAQNYLTGPLPAFIGNLSAMKYLTFGINALSGQVPKELGNLKNLISLGIGSNNFSGSLPPEFGNLTNLQQLYIDSSGLSGKLPPTLSSLQNMQTLWASDNNFTGLLPDYIGTWKNLQDLRFQGNSFQGPIPSSFSNLIQLTDLRIGDILSGRSSSLAMISNMTSLNRLILRNCLISDTLETIDFQQFGKLQLLDLSFNNISGGLPPPLFNLSSLQFLYLGNNSISGSLPSQISTNLNNIDLSYNQLSGAIPSWANQNNLQLNLAVNNFVINKTDESALSVGLTCLQRDFPCYHGNPQYSSLAIDCGSNRRITGSNGMIYVADDAKLGAASYYVTSPIQWGVSNVGNFLDGSNASYMIYSQSQFQNTLDTELFQTSRMSPSSLRYYGFGLENGNYTVELQFAETADDLTTWQSLFRRVFDIYVQGQLQVKDFDARKEAGGKSFVAVRKSFTALVTNNFLDIHLFWGGKGTCCIPSQGYYGPFIAALSVTPDFTPNVTNGLTPSSSTNVGTIVGVVVGVAALGLLAALAVLFWRQKRQRDLDQEELMNIVGRPYFFSYRELRSATNGFSSANIIGEGGYGKVYKGKLSDGRLVAVKELSETSHQGKQEFLTEIAAISAVQHRHLVKLHGCCIERNKTLLVYEFLENGSLDRALFGKNNLNLDWTTRFTICLGVARGLAYLHEESNVRIIHRDIKASNILLDPELDAKISDFGLAKLYDIKKTHVSSRIAGTIGYLAPEYVMRGHLTEKTDVFAFGMVILEIISGHANSEEKLKGEKVYLLDWVWNLYESEKLLELVDPKLVTYDKDEVSRLIGVALLCTQGAPHQRPPMSRVVSMLVGDIEVPEVTMRPSYLTEWQLHAAESSSFVIDSTLYDTQTVQVSGLSSSTVSATTTTDGSNKQTLFSVLFKAR